MKNLLRVIFIALYMISGIMYAAEQSKELDVSSDSGRMFLLEFENFYKKYALPDGIRPIFDRHFEECLESKMEACYHTPFFIKDHKIERIINAARMHEFIKINNVQCFDVPHKYLYMSKDRKYHVIADTIKAIPIGKMSLQEIHELVFLTTKTGYVDWHENNIVRRIFDKKLIIIDTEDRSFEDTLSVAKNYALYRLAHWKIAEKALKLLKESTLDKAEEALFFKDKKIDEILGINFFQVKLYYSMMNRFGFK